MDCEFWVRPTRTKSSSLVNFAKETRVETAYSAYSVLILPPSGKDIWMTAPQHSSTDYRQLSLSISWVLPWIECDTCIQRLWNKTSTISRLQPVKGVENSSLTEVDCSKYCRKPWSTVTTISLSVKTTSLITQLQPVKGVENCLITQLQPVKGVENCSLTEVDCSKYCRKPRSIVTKSSISW